MLTGGGGGAAFRTLLERAVVDGERLVTDFEVLQEILAIQPAFDLLLRVVDAVFGIDLQDVERAKVIVAERAGLSARDAIHVAVMERRGVERIMSLFAGFDAIPGVMRLS